MEFDDYMGFSHRDSTISLENGSGLDPDLLDTAAEVCGRVLMASASNKGDATQELVNLMRPAVLKRAVLDWLPMVKGTRSRRYNVVCEALGLTAVRRPKLAQAVDEAVKLAFPSWQRSSESAVRIVCKADPAFAFVGVQIHENLRSDAFGRPGSLRRHLACGLLQLAGVDEGSTVLDPFMGSGTILDAALRIYGADSVIGMELDAATYEVARARFEDSRSSLFARSFDELDLSLIDRQTRVVTNVPFGVRFKRVETGRLINFFSKCALAGATITALISRGQGATVARALRL
jgi:hypothetical protein